MPLTEELTTKVTWPTWKELQANAAGGNLLRLSSFNHRFDGYVIKYSV